MMQKPGLSLPPSLWQPSRWGEVRGEGRRGGFGGWVWGSRVPRSFFVGCFLGGGDQGRSLGGPWRKREGEVLLIGGDGLQAASAWLGAGGSHWF